MRSYPVKTCPRIAQAMIVLLLLSITLLTSACGKGSQERQTAQQRQARFDQQLQYAQQIGVPILLLKPLLQAEQQLASNSPFNLLSNQSANTYDHTLTTHYSLLSTQLQAVIASSTNQARSQTQQDLLDFQAALQQSQIHHQPTGNFSSQLDQAQADFLKAHYPKDYASISSQIHDELQALAVLANMPNCMATLKKAIEQANDLHLEISPLMSSYQQDTRMLDHIATLQAAQQLQSDVAAHYQQAIATVAVSIPYFTTSKLDALEGQIQLLSAQAQDITKYQQDLKHYSTMTAKKHMSITEYQDLASHLDDDITQAQMMLLRIQAHKLLKQLDSEAQAWGNTHSYHDSYNGQSYPLDVSYLTGGIESNLEDDLTNAANIQDLEQVIKQANNALFNLHIMEADDEDKTPYDQVHATDLQLINHYQLTGQIIIVSLAGQAMRLYQDGKLEQTFLITSGRAERPSLPGLWSIQERLSPTIFKSGDAPSSPYWYPDTPIHYAMLYHDGGYFIHDSWWRNTYGPGTQFPHADSSGDQQFAGNGSHGCINLQENQAAWLYNHTSWNTAVVVY